jgi:hypothetical protein
MKGLAVSLSLSLLLPLAASAGDEPTPFDTALDEAKRNAKRAGGEAFEASVGKEFGKAHGAKISACAKRVSKPDLGNFDLLVKLSLSGHVEEALVRPETNLATCLRDGMKDARLPAPETPHYWAHIGLKLKR